MNILFLRGFNNYHKRTIIKFSTLQDYQDNSASFLNYSGINFNPNDGVVTELVVGGPTQLENSKPLQFDTMGNPDYCVCYEMDEDQQVTIVSRWFILESVRLLNGQYRMALKRDVIADNRDWILNADCFIEKGQIMDDTSPLLFNNEAMTYNQIKKKEWALYDTTGCAWIVGYCAKNASADGAQCYGKITNGEANQPATSLDDEDLPFGTISATMLSKGFTFTTVNAINVLWKAGMFNDVMPRYMYQHCGRSRIVIKQGAVDYIDNNYSQRFRAPGIQYTDPLNIGKVEGDGLGEYYGEEGFFADCDLLPINSYKEGGKDMSFNGSTEQITSYFMRQTYSGRDVAENVVNESVNNAGYDYSGSSYIQGLKGKILRVSDGNGGYIYYTINVTPNDIVCNYYTPTVNATVMSEINDALTRALNLYNVKGSYQTKSSGTLQIIPQVVNVPTFACGNVTIAYDVQSFRISFTQLPPTLETKSFFAQDANRWGTNDQLFDMFCIPYGDAFYVNDNNVAVKCRKDAALACARSYATYLGSKLYDLQILPYCPIKEIREAYTTDIQLVNSSGRTGYSNRYTYGGLYYSARNPDDSNHISIQSSSIQAYRIYDKEDDNVIYGYVFWATESHGTFDIDIPSIEDRFYQYGQPISSVSLQKKISNETELFRLCSPNYNGLFEYSPAKNNNEYLTHPRGSGMLPDWSGTGNMVVQIIMRHINVDYTYRPGNPYIHVNPEFKDEADGGFYGIDWNDSRGLICQGDFSLGYIIDAFREYQIQNANFQNIFDRQIQNLDVMNSLQYEQTKFASTLGAIGMPVGGAATGALTGAKLGGGYGAIAGAAVGAVGGTVGGLWGYQKNMEWLERSQAETRSYMKDMYAYSLGNIQALPYSISKTDCLAENTRLVPFLEVYQASEKEVSNLLKVIKYNGMTVMAIGKPRDYIDTEIDLPEKQPYTFVTHDKACYYIKAKLILNEEEEFLDDFHMLDAIYAELDKGVYLQGYEVVEEEEEEEEDV